MTREEAIAFFRDMNECTYGNLEAVEMAIKALEQEPKEGHWIPRNSFLLKYKCSECNRESEEYNYCPYCGAKMVDPPESDVAESNKTYCTECIYFADVIYDGQQWFGARCDKDGHSTMPSMYAIKSLHDDCPLVEEVEPLESEVKE